MGRALAILLVLAACGGNDVSDDDDTVPDAPLPDSQPPATCGNGIVEGDEQCDDGDTETDNVCDASCRSTCGNGSVDDGVGETCDTGIATGIGVCPSTCDDSDSCTADVLEGTGCIAACVNAAITDAIDGDGCCPDGANANTDADCGADCGNGILETGELCDTAITAGTGSCPTTCNDGIQCTTDALVSGGTCQATCSATAITAPANGDGCCPAGANTGNDNDCLPGCGNGAVDMGETCDTGIASGTGSCPTTCSDGMTCTTDTLGNAGTCQAACSFPPITMPINNDGCCPATANANNDNNCTPRCGNGVPELGEACDDGNAVDTDACRNNCTLGAPPPTAYRFTDLDLRDPHAFVNFIGCRDVTDTQLVGFSVNNELQTSIQSDGDDADTFFDLSPTLVFRPFSTTTPTTPVELHFANCTATNTTCSPGADSPALATATNLASGTCLQALAGTTRPYAPAIANPAGPCFSTNAIPTVTINLGGIPIRLSNVRVAGTYSGTTTLTNGLMMGFISEADANATIIPADFPLVGGQPLSALLAGGSGACPSHSDKDTLNGTMGWWFYLNFPASRVPWTEP